MWARHQATAVLSLERIKLDFQVQGKSLAALESSASSCGVFAGGHGFWGPLRFPRGAAGGAVRGERRPERAEFADLPRPDHPDAHLLRGREQSLEPHEVKTVGRLRTHLHPGARLSARQEGGGLSGGQLLKSGPNPKKSRR